MISINPKEKFYIVRQLENAADTQLYYVRAVIRNASDDSLIENVNLVHQGNQRYTKQWEAPADPSNEGRYIIITTFVYSDSDYTTLSDIYGAVSEVYLVQKRLNYQSFGGVGDVVNYQKVREIIKEELDKKLIEVDKKINSIELIVDENKPNLIKIQDQLNSLLFIIDNIKIPEIEMPKIDLSGIIFSIDSLKKEMAAMQIEMIQKMKQRGDEIIPMFENQFDELSKKIVKIENDLDKIEGSRKAEVHKLVENVRKSLIDLQPYLEEKKSETNKKFNFAKAFGY